METNFTQKSAEILYCFICDFKCSKQSDLRRHMLTLKHKRKQMETEITQKSAEKKLYTCKICNKHYKCRSGLWKHNQLCIDKINEDINEDINENINENIIIIPEKTDNDIKQLTSVVLEAVKNNQDFQTQMLEMYKTIQTNIIINNNNNSNNTFNMQVFLNEECKDAMNISDFVNSVNIELEDLENVGKLGYVTGISNIIVKELKMLDVYKRPIHCSDIKRETFYIKDNDIWEKETPENNKMKKTIKGISQKNMIKLNDWRDKHPDCLDSSSSFNDIYLNLMVESCGGRGDFVVGENKILKNIAKEVVIKK
jgi:hypothetical protein